MRIVSLLLLLPLAVVLGCSNQGRYGVNTNGEVSGKVTIDGEPVTAGDVFMISANELHSASGAIRGDGTYTVKEPPLGDARIAVKTLGYKGMKYKPGPKGKGGPGSAGMVMPDPSERGLIYVPIPPKYEEYTTSDLTYTVPPGKSNHDLPLTRK